ncbi:unnamed protein product, partial [Polarella glacialis]
LHLPQIVPPAPPPGLFQYDARLEDKPRLRALLPPPSFDPSVPVSWLRDGQEEVHPHPPLPSLLLSQRRCGQPAYPYDMKMPSKEPQRGLLSLQSVSL